MLLSSRAACSFHFTIPLSTFFQAIFQSPDLFLSLQLGATLAIGVDIDELAVSAASHNAGLNGLRAGHDFTALLSGVDEAMGPRIRSAVAEMEGGEGCNNEIDVLVANILVNPLVELAPSLATWTKPGGIIGLSGVLTSQVGLCGTILCVDQVVSCAFTTMCICRALIFCALQVDVVVKSFSNSADVIEVCEENGWALIHLKRHAQ